jgi:glycosyltransferase involved in cell wall biosynthesis
MSRIAVIIPTYQHSESISKTLDGIFAQTRQADEMVVVDDGSTDQTQDVLLPYRDRIKIIFQNHTGAPGARNNGFKNTTADLVLFCDSDVRMRPGMLERLENALREHPDKAYAYCRFRWGWKTFGCRAFDARALRHRNFIHTSAALIRRETFPGFDETLTKLQDWDVWLTMLEQGSEGVFVDKELFTVRQSTGRINLSSWLPRFVYALPWSWIKWRPVQVADYQRARDVIVNKHGL